MPSSPPLQQIDRTYVRVGRRQLIYFGGCDYFRLSTHPHVQRAVLRGLRNFGLNVAASRMTTGNHQLYERLERELENYFGADAAVLCSSGYASNLAAGQAMAGQFTHAFLDERAHASLFDAATLLDCSQTIFGHRNPLDLHWWVARAGKQARVIVLTDGLFAHDGSVAPLREYQELLPRTAWLLVDDAHAGGVIGQRGRGSVELEKISRRQVIQTVTLSKAFGVYGGAVLGSEKVRQAVIERSRCYSGNTPLPLPLAEAALTAVQWLGSHPQQRERLHQNVRYVQDRLTAAGWDLPKFPGPIIPFLPSKPNEAATFSRRLIQAGIHPPFIRYPGGPSSGYFRFALSSAHTRDQLNRLIGVLGGHVKNVASGFQPAG